MAHDNVPWIHAVREDPVARIESSKRDVSTPMHASRSDKCNGAITRVSEVASKVNSRLRRPVEQGVTPVPGPIALRVGAWLSFY